MESCPIRLTDNISDCNTRHLIKHVVKLFVSKFGAEGLGSLTQLVLWNDARGRGPIHNTLCVLNSLFIRQTMKIHHHMPRFTILFASSQFSRIAHGFWIWLTLQPFCWWYCNGMQLALLSLKEHRLQRTWKMLSGTARVEYKQCFPIWQCSVKCQFRLSRMQTTSFAWL